MRNNVNARLLLRNPTSENKAMAKKGELLVARHFWDCQPARLFCSRQTIESLLPCPAIFIVMQCKLVIAFVVACFAMTVSAAPVGANEAAVVREPEALNLRLPRIEVAREPEPVVEEAREPKPEPGCTLYTCI
ncbi:hypothetical protein R3P38DRAFT_3256322 [Favolaschia claudopus]|uniref:Uncharacterized protein n=1 Tax=Favolaschia claudopus TaxID=2862362 RepID=A0AAW0DJP9_9AGAR